MKLLLILTLLLQADASCNLPPSSPPQPSSPQHSRHYTYTMQWTYPCGKGTPTQYQYGYLSGTNQQALGTVNTTTSNNGCTQPVIVTGKSDSISPQTRFYVKAFVNGQWSQLAYYPQ